MIAFSCPACAKKLTVKPELAGKKIKCPGCGHVMEAPAAPAAVASQARRMAVDGGGWAGSPGQLPTPAPADPYLPN